MAEVVLSFATEEILKKVVSVAAQEVRLAWGFQGELTRLGESLKMIQAVLRDAEQRQEKEEAVRLWLKNLEGIAYEADDVLDEFAYEILRRKVELQNRMKNKVRNFFSLSNPIGFRLKMAHKVNNINISLDKIKNDATGFRLAVVGQPFLEHKIPQFNQQNPRETDSFVDDSQVVGRKDDVAKIVKMLTSKGNEQVLSVIAIVGIGGLGKTTLAQSVCNNDEIKRHFDKRIWVCVSDIFEDKRILRECLESLDQGQGRMDNKDAILKKLQEELEGKRYLLLLDDVWNEDPGKWDDLKSRLLGLKTDSTGNCVLVTTRSDEVASIMETLPRHRLGGLSDDACWSIFKNGAFADGRAPVTPDLEIIGRKIAKKCAGVPLIAKVLGGMMCSKTEKDDWLSIQNNEILDLPEHENGILPILKLSFDHLPSSSLKQCFAYCSMFPEDFVIDKDDLVQLWMAQGLLQPSPGSNQEMEDLGYNYFDILLAKSFFQDAEKDQYGSIKYCKMHDLMHDLAQKVSGVDSLTLEPKKAVNDTKEIRHLSLIPTEEIVLPTISRESVRKMRTLFAMDMDVRNMSISIQLANLEGLRVLNLQGACYIFELPKSIGKLKHLRYLDISRTSIGLLPKSIGKLYNLQTLRLLGCRFLERFPNELKNLINLRHFCISDWAYGSKEMPIEMGRLTCLQTLPIFIVGQERGRQIEELGSLNQLRGKLSISHLERVMDGEAAKKANLLMKTNIHELIFDWSSGGMEGNNTDEDVLEGLQPPPNLKGLEIRWFKGNKFPSWVMKMMVRDLNVTGFCPLKNLVEIKLHNCKKCEQIPKLGHLPCLKYLEIAGMENVKCIEDEFYGYNDDDRASKTSSGGDETLFPSLETFSLSWMPNLVEWMEATAMQTAGVVVFPRLEKLVLCYCFQLTTVPTHFSSLRELEVDSISISMPLENISRNLTTLTEELLQNNKNLASLRIRNCPALTSLSIPDVSGCYTSLRSMYLQGCEKLRFLSNGLHTLVSLEDLDIHNCRDLESIPSMHGLTSLCKLKITKCNALTSLPSGLQFCTTLENLEVGNCPNLISIPEDSLELCYLLNLIIQNCEKLKRLPEGLTRLKSLTIGGLSEELMKSMPDHLQHLTALTTLKIYGFNEMEALPEWLGNISSLESLRIYTCKNLMYLPTVKAMRSLSKLRLLGIENCPLLKERCAKGSGPEWFKISHIPQVVIDQEMEALPEWLGNLSSLESLGIRRCKNLMYLPTVKAMRSLSKLRRLTISGCPLLEERCARGSGPEWFKISHIPTVRIW